MVEMSTDQSSSKSRKVKLQAWNRNVQKCTLCDICNYSKYKVTYEVVGDNPEILFLGEAPGDVEYAEKTPFIGPSGNILRDIIEESIGDTPHILVNSVLCPPYTDKTMMKTRMPGESEVKNCSTHIRKLIRIFKPKYIIAVGKVAERSLAAIGITEYKRVMHPSAINRSGKDYHFNFEKTIMDIERYIQ